MKLNSKNTALFYVIENRDQLIIETKKSIYHMLKSNGWTKNISIFLVTPTELILTDDVKKAFKNIYNKIYFIEENCVTHNDHAFFNMIYGAELAERKIPATFKNLMYIDCDMYLLKDMPDNFDADIVVEVEDKFNINNMSEWLVDKNKWFKLLKLESNYYINTEFIIAKRKLHLFKSWLDEFNKLYPKLKIYKKAVKNLDISAMEESSFEIALFYNYFKKNVVIEYKHDFIARLSNPVIMPENQNKILFISAHIDKEDENLFEHTVIKKLLNKGINE